MVEGLVGEGGPLGDTGVDVGGGMNVGGVPAAWVPAAA